MAGGAERCGGAPECPRPLLQAPLPVSRETQAPVQTDLHITLDLGRHQPPEHPSEGCPCLDWEPAHTRVCMCACVCLPPERPPCHMWPARRFDLRDPLSFCKHPLLVSWNLSLGPHSAQPTARPLLSAGRQGRGGAKLGPRRQTTSRPAPSWMPVANPALQPPSCPGASQALLGRSEQ